MSPVVLFYALFLIVFPINSYPIFPCSVFPSSSLALLFSSLSLTLISFHSPLIRILWASIPWAKEEVGIREQYLTGMICQPRPSSSCERPLVCHYWMRVFLLPENRSALIPESLFCDGSQVNGQWREARDIPPPHCQGTELSDWANTGPTLSNRTQCKLALTHVHWNERGRISIRTLEVGKS